MSEFIEWSSLANVVVFGILVGAGLPALFALGVRALAGPGAKDEEGRSSALRPVLGWILFGVAGLSVVGAIAFLAAGGH